MKSLKLMAVMAFYVVCASAQKKAPLPKDLPPYAEEKPLRAPVVKVLKLDNGLAVWLVSGPSFPKTSFAVGVRGGLAADPADRPGVSELLSNTIDQGTKSRTARQIAEEIQAAGGDLDTTASKDAVVLSTSVLSSKLESALTLVADVLENASFPDSEVAIAKHNLSDSLQQRESDPSFLASRAMARALFGDSPYHVTAPTEESLVAATPVELRKIYRQRFRPDHALFVAVGDFQTEKMLAQVTSKLGGWTNPSESAPPEPARVSWNHKSEVFFVNRPGSVQTTLRLGTLGPLRGDPDYEATQVANAIYGGTFGSRLTSNIREDKGYTYSPFATLNTFRATGVVSTQADVRNEVTAASFNEIIYELNRLATTSPTEEELTTAKRYLVGIESIRLQSRAAVARELASLWVQGLHPDAIGSYGEKISNLTATDVNTAAKKYFPAAHCAIVAVGEEKVVRDAFDPFGLSIEAAH